MASLDSLPPDQRAVLQLVLQRGRSYDQIAEMLSIDRAAVRDRALTAFDAIGPQTRVAAERRALITDYLLGQLPDRVATMTAQQLADSAPDRAWARVLAAELAPLAKSPLPEIPAEGTQVTAVPSAPVRRSADQTPVAEDRRPADDQPAVRAEPRRRRQPQETADTASDLPTVAAVSAGTQSTRTAEPEATEPGDEGYGRRDREYEAARRSSRRGGAILIGVVGVVAVIVVVIVIATSGGSSPKPTTQVATTPSTPTGASSTPSTSTTSSTSAQVVGQVTLAPPSGAKSPVGIAQIVKQGSKLGIVIVASKVPANSNNAYAVWLYNSPSDNSFLGFVNPAVKSDGQLKTAGPLTATATKFKQLLITAETVRSPTAPSKSIVLEGSLKIG